jgi:hypothetical protein
LGPIAQVASAPAGPGILKIERLEVGKASPLPSQSACAQLQLEESAVIEGPGLESLRRLVTVIATISEHVANEAANYLSMGKG